MKTLEIFFLLATLGIIGCGEAPSVTDEDNETTTPPRSVQTLRISRVFASIADSNSIVSSGHQTFDIKHTIPANTLKPGATIRIRAAVAIEGSAGGGNVTLELDIGGNRVATTAPYAVWATQDVIFDAAMTIRSTGVFGSVWSSGFSVRGLGSPAIVGNQAHPATTTFNTTIENDVVVECNFTVDGNSAVLKQLIVDIA